MAWRDVAWRGVTRSTLDLANLHAGEDFPLTYFVGGGKVKKPRTRLDALGSTMANKTSGVYDELGRGQTDDRRTDNR